MLPLNQKETVELKQWLSQYMRTINRNSGVYTTLHAISYLFNNMHRIQFI